MIAEGQTERKKASWIFIKRDIDLRATRLKTLYITKNCRVLTVKTTIMSAPSCGLRQKEPFSHDGISQPIMPFMFFNKVTAYKNLYCFLRAPDSCLLCCTLLELFFLA